MVVETGRGLARWSETVQVSGETNGVHEAKVFQCMQDHSGMF